MQRLEEWKQLVLLLPAQKWSYLWIIKQLLHKTTKITLFAVGILKNWKYWYDHPMRMSITAVTENSY